MGAFRIDCSSGRATATRPESLKRVRFPSQVQLKGWCAQMDSVSWSVCPFALLCVCSTTHDLSFPPRSPRSFAASQHKLRNKTREGGAEAAAPTSFKDVVDVDLDWIPAHSHAAAAASTARFPYKQAMASTAACTTGLDHPI